LSLRHFRIDDRLVHGQVLIGWGSQFDYTIYIVCASDEDLAAWEMDMYLAAIPAEADGHVLRPQAIAAHISELLNKRIMVVFKSPGLALQAQRSGLEMPEIIVGGLHDKPERHAILDFVFVSAEEKESLCQLMANGSRVYAQDLPGNSRYAMSNLLKE
jgi:mannose/fructose/N-acetylgalactosamine-specific phosphotransferase system component IIB